jgi:Arc/MetJ family transcription regulator
LTDAAGIGIYVCMRTTLNIDDALLQEAARVTGVQEKTALIHRGLRALVEKAARDRLIQLGGKDASAASIPRRRSR